jgi:predicted MPP superfamily phosphohydrolase
LSKLRSGDRTSLVSWFNNRLGPKAPFTDPAGGKGAWAPFTRAPAHRVVTYHIPLKGVGARPWQVALLADLHIGSQAGDVARLATIVAETNDLAPDLILLLGDYMNMMPFGGGRVPPDVVAEALAGLAAPAGVHAVFGNHEWKYGYDAVAAAFAEVGLPVIDNRIAVVERGGDRLALVGLEDDRRGKPDLRLFDQLPPGLPVLVATHNPGLFHDVPEGHVVVAGHTHGGQIRWPTLPPPTVPSGRAPRRWAHGHIRERGHLIVSAGLGVSGLPWRLGIAPEIVMVELAMPEPSSSGGARATTRKPRAG